MMISILSLTSNARRQARPIAEATQERRLLGVACRVEPMVTHPAPLPISGASRVARLPDTLPASVVRGIPAGLVTWWKHSDHARACGHPVPHSGHVVKETGGSPTFPSSPCEDMPRSQTPVVSCALAIAHPGLLPSSACTPSASPQLYPFRGSMTRPAFSLHPAPYGPLLGGTRVRYCPAGSALVRWDLNHRFSPTGKQQPIAWSDLQCQGFGLTLAQARRS